MSNTMILMQAQKRKIFEVIQKISPEKIQPILIEAVLKNLVIPIESFLTSRMCMHRIDIPEVKKPLGN